MTSHDTAHIYQINISNGGVPKWSIENADVSVDGIKGDQQKNRKVHGGIQRALCLYALEKINGLRDEGHPIQPGSSGENLTICGLEWSLLHPGDELSIGKALKIEITSYAEPCRYNARWFKDNNYKRISQKIHPGWSRVYAKVLAEGTVHRGDAVFVDIKEPLESQA